MKKEQLKKKFEAEIGVQNDYFNHRGGLMNEVFEWFWKELGDGQNEQLRGQIKEPTDKASDSP